MSDTKHYSDLDRRITSHASIITVDRPDSSQLVDLHVYFLPRSFWKDKLNLAYNDAMEEAVSAGFVRVRNQLTLQELRNEIDGQCGNEIDIFPKEYIFLRSVGRALTRVKERQEYELKVKNFRPPQTYAPEIFVLEARHEDFNGMNSSLMSPSQNSIVTSRQQKVVPLKSSVMDQYHNKSLEPIKSSSTARIDDKDFDAYEWVPSTNNSSRGPRLDRAKELQKLQEEQDRLKKRQSELERLRQEAEERQRRQKEEELKRKQQQQPQLHHYQQQQQQQQPYESPKHVQQQYQKQNQSPQHQYNQQQQQQPQKAQQQQQQQQKQQQSDRHNNDYDKYKQQQQEAAVKIQKTYRGYRDRKKVKNIKDQKQEELNKRERLLKEQELAAKRKEKEKENELNRKSNNNSRLANSIQSNDVDYLRKKLESVKTSRMELENSREDLIKRLKQIHNRITLRRKEARDLWKKKYFAEKKKTPPLEEKVEAEVSEIENLQKRIYAHIESDTKNGGHDNEHAGVKLASLKLQQEIDGLKRQVEQAKLRLTTDIKLRNQAETEIKALKSELGQTKINLHHIKSKILSSNNDFNELMTTRE